MTLRNAFEEVSTEATLAEVRDTVATLATEASAAAINSALTTLAKDTSVDGVEGLLTTISGKDFATHAEQVAMEAILTQIATNTATAVVDVAALNLTADQVNLNTDSLEALLTTLNGKDFATASKQDAEKAVIDAINTKLGGTLTADIIDRSARLLGHVTVDNSSLVVTGPLTDAQLRATAIPVSGTFWQATQPVSGPLTDTQLRASAFAVDPSDRSGRLLGHVTVDNASFPVTQSGSWSLAANQSVNQAQVAGTATDTNSGNKSAGTQRVVLATDQPALTNALKVDGSAVIQPVSGTFWQATQPVSLAGAVDLSDKAARILGRVGSDYAVQDSGVLSATGVATTQDCSTFQWQESHVRMSGFTGSVIFEVSNDNVNWASCLVTLATGGVATSTSTGAASSGEFIYHGPVNARYFRARVSAYTSGTVQVISHWSAVSGAWAYQPTYLGGAASNLGDATLSGLLGVVGGFVFNGTNWDRIRSANAQGDGVVGTGVQGVGPWVFNGTNWDRVRGANAAAATTGTGLAGSGTMYWDGTNWQKLSSVSGGLPLEIWNGGSWQKVWGANGAGGTAGAQLLGAGILGYDGSNWQRLGASSSGVLYVGGNVASGSADSGNPVKVGGKYNSTAPTLTDGQRGDLQLDASGRTVVSLGTKIAGEDITNDVQKVEQRFSYSNITTNATTTVKSGAGFLHSITINTKGASANVATIYDNTAGSGTKIGTLDTTAGVTSLRYDVSFATGLTIVTATGTAADITVSYR